MRALLFCCVLVVPFNFLLSSPAALGQAVAPPEQTTTDESASEETEEANEQDNDGDAADGNDNSDEDASTGDNQENSDKQTEEDNANADDVDSLKMADPPEDVNEALSKVWKSVWEMWNSFLGRLPLFILAFAVLVLTWFIASLAQRLARRMLRGVSIRGSLKDLIRQFLYIGIWIAGLTVAAGVIFPGLNAAK
ncbi:MAG: hypothetical protein RID07_07930, partial [Lacipirellulaceae bacterium]